jgi:hypothetical protein
MDCKLTVEDDRKNEHIKVGNKVIALTEFGPVVDTIKSIESINPAVKVVYFNNFDLTYAHPHQIYVWSQEREDNAKESAGGIHKFDENGKHLEESDGV